MGDNLLLNPEGVQVTPTPEGSYIPGSMRSLNWSGYLYVQEIQSANLLGLRTRIEYSTDGGTTWRQLMESAVIHTEHQSFSRWVEIPAEARINDLQVRAMAVGLGTAKYYYIELDKR